jgi:hypothetical protein
MTPEPYGISDDGMVLVEWTDLGEGIEGDYDPTDPDDEPLLRYDAYIRMEGGDKDEGLEFSFYRDLIAWGTCDNSSFCTNVHANTPDAVLHSLAKDMANELSLVIHEGWKSRAQQLSWVDSAWNCPCGAYISPDELAHALN